MTLSDAPCAGPSAAHSPEPPCALVPPQRIPPSPPVRWSLRSAFPRAPLCAGPSAAHSPEPPCALVPPQRIPPSPPVRWSLRSAFPRAPLCAGPSAAHSPEPPCALVPPQRIPPSPRSGTSVCHECRFPQGPGCLGMCGGVTLCPLHWAQASPSDAGPSGLWRERAAPHQPPAHCTAPSGQTATIGLDCITAEPFGGWVGGV